MISICSSCVTVGDFAGRAHRHQTVDAALDLVLDQSFQIAIGDLALVKGSDERGDRAGKLTWSHGSF